MADTAMVKACPGCDATQIRRTSSKPNGGQSPTQYVCSRCGNHFDRPVTRERRGQGGPQRGLAKQLHEVAPDAVGRDA